jgi:hypothetical protein
MLSRVFVISIFVLSLFCFINDSFAFEIGTQEVGIIVTESYVSRYIWRGQDLFGNNDGAYQPSIDIAFPGLLNEVDVAFNVWGSIPLSKGHEAAEEMDYTVSLSRDIEEFTISSGYTYYAYAHAHHTTEVQEPWVSLSLNKLSALGLDVVFNVFAGYNFEATSGGIDAGWYYSWGFDTELPLPEAPFLQDEQTLALGIVNWGNDGVAGLKPSSLYATELSISTSYAFGDFSISPSLNYTINYEDQINSGDEELWAGIELSCGF